MCELRFFTDCRSVFINVIYVCVDICWSLRECIYVYFCVYLSIFWGSVYVAISWQERQMSPQVLWVLCFSGWHTSYCNMTMEPPWINQHLVCLETGAPGKWPRFLHTGPWLVQIRSTFISRRCDIFLFIWKDKPVWHAVGYACVCVWVCQSTGI